MNVNTNSVEQSAVTNSQTPLEKDRPETRKHCIAVLDDNTNILQLLRATLEGDYIVEEFDSAADLLEFLKETPCDLIVSDLCLPGIDGFGFISALKKNTRLRGIPVVAYTANASDEIRAATLAAGFVCCLEKLGPLKRLLEVIAQHL